MSNRPLLALEFHAAAVAVLDAFCDQTWGDLGAAPEDDQWRPNAGKWNAIVGFGAFFGELMRRQFGGEWRDDDTQPDNVLASSVVLKGGHEIFAIAKVYKRLKNGSSDRIEPLYLYMRQQLGLAPSATEVDGWVRQGQHFEGVGRPDLAVRFYDRALALVPAGGQRTALERLRAASLEASGTADAAARERATAEARRQIRELAQRGRAALAAFGVRPDHGALTLFGLDTFLDERVGSGPVANERRPTDLELQLGAFVGELLCTRYRGSWGEEPAPALAGSKVTWPSGLAALPFDVVTRRIAKGAPGVLEQVTTLVKSLVAQGDAADPPEDPRDWLLQADDYASKVGRLDLAVRLATVGLRFAEGDSAAARLKVAGWCRSLGRLDEAQQHVEAGLRLRPEDPALGFEQARVALERGDAAVAEAAATRALANRPEAPFGHVLRAAALVAQGRTELAKEAFESALELDPACAPALLGKARALLSLDRASEARDWLDVFTGRSDCEPERSYLAGLAAESSGDPVGARELFGRVKDEVRLSVEQRAQADARVRALALDPRVRVAEIERLPDLEAAVSAYARLNADHPTLVEPWRERGVGLAMLGRTKEAIECFHRAAALDPAEPSSYDHEAAALGREKRFAEGVAALDRGLVSCPSSGLLLARKAIFLSLSGHPEEALRVCEEALVADPGHADTWAFKGDTEHRLGRIEEAIRSIERYLAACSGSREKRVQAARRQLFSLRNPGRVVDSDRARDCQHRALARVAQGAFSDALALLDAAVAADPLFDDAWINRGSCLYDLSRFEEALDSFARAEDLGGQTSLVAGVIAECHFRLGRGAEALAVYDRILARPTRDPETLRGKARLLARMGRAAEALPLYQRLVARSPQDATLARERAGALRAASRPLEALAAYEALLASAPGDSELRTARDDALRALGRTTEIQSAG